MTPKRRFLTALERGIPDRVPTFELEFQLSREMMGRDMLTEDALESAPAAKRDAMLEDNARFLIDVYRRLEHDAICIQYLNEEHTAQTAQLITEYAPDEFALFAHGDGTIAIPDGDGMAELSYQIADEPERVHDDCKRMRDEAIRRDLYLLEHGLDGLILCSDYCFNQGPFLSPGMFSEYITPYLAALIAEIRAHGGYAIKHTDGNIMPIIDQLVDANPHALHSLDPMAGVDIAEVKRVYGDRVALCGNVHCAAMQTGSDQDVIDSAEYCLTHGKPGGGYVFCTSNVPFKGMKLERYLMVLDVWRRMRDY